MSTTRSVTLKTHLGNRLQEELRETSRVSASTGLVLLCIYQYSIFLDIKDNLVNWIAVGFLVLTHLVRYAQARFSKSDSTPWMNQFSALIFLTAFSWMLMCGNAIINLSSNKEALIMSHIILAGLTSSAAFGLSISKRDFFIFQSFIIATVLFALNYGDLSSTFKMSGSLVVVLFIAFLAKQRKIREENWRKQESLNFELQKIMDAFPGGVSVLKGEKYDRVNQYANDSFNSALSEKNTAAPRRLQIVGSQLGHLDARNGVFVTKIKEFIQSGEKRTQFEADFMIGKESRTHLVIASQIDDHETVIASIDIHGAKQIQAKLENSSKMAALGEMSGGLAHEINTPLANISVRTQYLLETLATEDISREELVRSLESIDKTTFRIAKIIKGLRSFARDVGGDPLSLADLSEIVEDTINFCDMRFKSRGIELRLEIPQDLKILCRPTQISQVLLNTLNNSCDAISESAEKWIVLKAEQRFDKIIISITDSGQGIAAELRDKLMLPFFTTREVGKGTGLGLSLSRGIIESHQGQIYFNFDHPTNTQLIIELPVPQVGTLNKAS